MFLQKNAIVKIITERGCVRVDLCKIEPKTVVLFHLVVSWKSTFYPRYKVVTEMGRSLFLKAGTSIRFGEALDGQRCKILIRISSAALNT